MPADFRHDAVLAAVDAALPPDEPIVLAVSGGIDSMVLMDAAARIARGRIAAVATYDHRSGAHSSRAANHVRVEGRARGLRVIVGRARAPLRGEAAWRKARWAFLSMVAGRFGARVATAHTRDDQLETVCIRVLRGAGARGLAGLHAPSRVVRPLVDIDRAAIVAYARRHRISHLEDPTNASRKFLRNRLRLDIIPALREVDPAFEERILALAREAASLRAAIDAFVSDSSVSRVSIDRGASDGGATARSRRTLVAEAQLASLRDLDDAALRTLVPAIAARANIILDRRGTTRLAAFILRSRQGARIQLSGGAEATRAGDVIRIGRGRSGRSLDGVRALNDEADVGPWRFRRVSGAGARDAWTAALPIDASLTVRGWRPGDRMRAAGSPAARRVKRFLREAGIAGSDRNGWPVVLADGEIVWIPGVRRSDAATERSGRPALRYRCERHDA